MGVASGIGRILAVCAAICGTAMAQDVPRYSPQRPTLSPYLNLTRGGVGGLPNYYSLVRPQQNQQAFQRRATAVVQSQGFAIQSLSTLATARPGGPTGSGSVYKNLSHFFPQRQAFQKR